MQTQIQHSTKHTTTYNTGIGFHYYPDELHYRSTDLDYWLPKLQNLGASWLTLVSSTNRSIPETFLSPLVQSGIEPIIHIKTDYIKPLDIDVIKSTMHAYANWGIKYICVFDCPNMRMAWKTGHFEHIRLVERFVDCWIPIAQLQIECGLPAVLTPLYQGGIYWDTSFLGAVLEAIVNRQHQEIIDKLVLGIYSFAGGHAADWGRGGNKTWPASQPYRTPPGSQDQTGFWSFDWYAEIMANVLGNIRPMLMIAGGARQTQINNTTKQNKDIAWHTTCNTSIANAMLSGHLPDYLLNVNFWLLCADEDHPALDDAWLSTEGDITPAATELQNIITKTHPSMITLGREYINSLNTQKTLKHYILLPRFDWGLSEWHWNVAGPLVQEHNACCGYSIDAALLSETVTIVANHHEISLDVESKLKQAGCRIHRINSEDLKVISRKSEVLSNKAMM